MGHSTHRQQMVSHKCRHLQTEVDHWDEMGLKGPEGERSHNSWIVGDQNPIKQQKYKKKML